MLSCRFFVHIQANFLKFGLTAMVFCVCGCAASLSSQQQTIVDTLHFVTHQLPDHARRISLSPAGILEIETTKSQSAYDKGIGDRTFMDVLTGSWIWRGDLRNGHMITDSPSPVIVETSEDSYTVIRFDRIGRVVWKSPLSGLFLFGLADEDREMLLTLALMQTNDGSVEAIAQGIALMDGRLRWHANLGQVSMKDHEIGSLWRYHERPIFGHQGKAFLLIENRAVCISIEDGQVLSNNPILLDPKIISRGRLTWLPLENDVVVVTGGYAHRLSDQVDRQWSIAIGENKTATGSILVNDHVIIAFDGEKEHGLAVLDAANATIRWQKAIKNGSGNHPDGVAVAGEGIFIASDNQLYCFSEETGDILFSEKISKAVSRLFSHKNDIVLRGSNIIELRSSLNGKTIWKHDNLDSPLAWFYKQKKSSMAAVSASMQVSAAISANQSRWYFNQSGKKIGGSYAYDPWTRLNYTKLGRSAASSAAISKMGASLTQSAGTKSSSIQRMVSIIVDMQAFQPAKDHTFFLVPVTTKVLTGQTNTAKLLAVNLVDGSTDELPVRKAPMTCIPTVIVHEQLELIIQAYHKFPFCTASKTIDILKLPIDSSQ